jgi:hypothetical protein
MSPKRHPLLYFGPILNTCNLFPLFPVFFFFFLSNNNINKKWRRPRVLLTTILLSFCLLVTLVFRAHEEK